MANNIVSAIRTTLKPGDGHVVLDRGPKPSAVDQVQWDSNPYASFDYRRTPWQSLIEALGFRSKFDEFRESMALNSAEYDAQLAEKAHNEQYDSAQAQVARERSAGINPDIAGDVSAGGSSSMEPDPNAPISPQADDVVGKVTSFANLVMSAFTGAIGLAKDGLSLFQLKNDVERGNIENSLGIFDFAMRSAREFIPESYPEGDWDWVNRASDLASDRASLFLSRKQLKQFTRNVRGFYSSAPTQASQWDSWLKNMKGKQDWFTASGSEFWQDGSDEVLRIVTDNLAKYNDRILKASLSSQALSAENAVAYQSEIDPALQAGVENTTNERNLHSANIDGILNECLDSIISDLRDRSDSGKKGHGLAQIALLLFSVLRMVNISKSSHVGQTPLGPVNTSTTSFGF